MLQIMSMGCLDSRWNQDSVKAKRSSVCCSGYNKRLGIQIVFPECWVLSMIEMLQYIPVE